jgi:hypothetical protein
MGQREYLFVVRLILDNSVELPPCVNWTVGSVGRIGRMMRRPYSKTNALNFFTRSKVKAPCWVYALHGESPMLAAVCCHQRASIGGELWSWIKFCLMLPPSGSTLLW